MKAARGALTEGAELAVGVEPCDHRIAAEYVLDCLDLFLAALLHHELAADTADQKGQIWSHFAKPREADLGRGRRAVDEIVDVGLHELCRSPSGDIARERHGLVMFVHGQDSANDALVGILLGDQYGEQQR